MNSKAMTMIKLVVTAAIIIALASVAVLTYSNMSTDSDEDADYASIVILNDATTAYAMMNGIELGEVFSGIGDNIERIQKLVSEQYLIKSVEPVQEDAFFEWEELSGRWIISKKQALTGEKSQESGESQNGGDRAKSTEENTGPNEKTNGVNQDTGYEIYGYGVQYQTGARVWFDGDFYVSRKDTKNVPGSHKDWQKETDEWFMYNTYETGETVWVNGIQYRAKKENAGKNPESKKKYWEIIG